MIPMARSVVKDDRELVQSRGKPSGRGGTRAASTNGPRDVSAQPSEAEWHLSGIARVVYEALKSDEMTARLCRIIITTATGLAIILAFVAAIIFIAAVKAPLDWKYILGAGSTVAISAGSLIFSRWRIAKHLAKRLPPGKQ